MFTSRIILALSLLIVPFAYSNTQPQLELGMTEQEAVAFMEQIEQVVAHAKAVGGLYIVVLVDMSVNNQEAVVKTVEMVSKHPLFDGIIGMPDPSVVFKSVAGKAEAEKLKKALEKLGCTVELLEMPA